MSNEQLPRSLRQLIEQTEPELHRLGFVKLTTGARLKMREGAADSYYQIWSSPEGHSTVEFARVQCARFFSILPIPLPFPELTGPSVLTFAFESLFENNDTLHTDFDYGSPVCDLPFVIVNRLEKKHPSFLELWKFHQAKLAELLQDGARNCILLDTREAHFQKEQTQREMIAELSKRQYQQLRQETAADLWDSQGPDSHIPR